tara:strand:+ start:1757 stop:2332 length:576 start_codon:yes stop_codon:yes gene_type:complete
MKRTLTYRITLQDRDEHGYGHTWIDIATREENPVVEKLTRSLQDAGYYGSKDRWEKYLQMGYERHFNSFHMDHQVELHWQHYLDRKSGEESYCSHSINKFSGGLREAHDAVRFLGKLSRRIAKIEGRDCGKTELYHWGLESPRAVEEALIDMKGVRIEAVNLPDFVSDFLEYKGPPASYRGDNLLERIANA